ncbi:MAG: AAA family ATPase [Treponema sp.]|nr:AAA family ATPase [Treponema sp.]
MSFIDTKNGFEQKNTEVKKHEEKPSTYSVADKIFQINTWNTPTHSDQVIQFDEDGLKDLIQIIKKEYPAVFEKDELSFDVPLFDADGKLQYCFRWGFLKDGITLRDTSRTGNEAYIALPPSIYDSDFYPKNGIEFDIKTDDSKTLHFVRAQSKIAGDDNGHSLETTNSDGQDGNKELGKYLRLRLGIASGEPITKEAVTKYGNDKITFSKDENGNYYLSFKPGIKFEKQPLILYGPPGTGKTYKIQHEYIDKFKKEDCFVTTFHQSFSYEEFVEGLKPVLSSTSANASAFSDVKYEIQKGIFYKACERAAVLAEYDSLLNCISASDRSAKMNEAIENRKIVLLCIDEINRANVSAVFGDLISLIEPSKRIGAKNEMIVQLPYSKEAFAVPANLMIVGTMNTADRSIQLLDSALRRRFRFEELLPDYDKIENTTAKLILQKINARIRGLLDKDHQIGHSYFIEAETDIDIFNALKDCVIPLLEEYFYNDAQKIRQILNETSESENNFYVKDSDAMSELNNMQNDYDNEKELFILNPALIDVKDNEKAKSFINHIVSIAE